jgi:hypothetical protein
MRTVLRWVLVLALVAGWTPRAAAGVNVERKGSENPMVEVSRSVIYGGLAGLVLGLAFAVASEGDDGDVIRWSFFAGTVAGLGFGIYHVATRPQPDGAALELEGGVLRAGVPDLTVDPRGAVRVRVAAYRF